MEEQQNEEQQLVEKLHQLQEDLDQQSLQNEEQQLMEKLHQLQEDLDQQSLRIGALWDDVRQGYAQLMEKTQIPQRHQSTAPNGVEGSTMNLTEMSLFRQLPPSIYAILQYMENKKEQEPERFAGMTPAQVARDLTDEEIDEVGHWRKATEKQWPSQKSEKEQLQQNFYRQDEENLINQKFWPKTKCRLLQRLLENQRNHAPDTKNREPEQKLSEINQRTTLRRILKESTKRIIMDHHQFAVFNDHAHEEMPEDTFADLHWPFEDDIYVEFNEPFSSQNDDEDITLEGFLVVGEENVRTVCFAVFENDQYVMRSMDMDLTTGVEVMPPHYQSVEPDLIMPKVISLTMAYMTARGIHLVAEPLPRNLRRQVERGKIPNPWYVIRAEHPSPRYPKGQEPVNGVRHGYRYDVIGHFRIGQYRLADGSYRTRRSWVRPHQRGLANEIYLPGTRRFNEPRPEQQDRSSEGK